MNNKGRGGLFDGGMLQIIGIIILSDLVFDFGIFDAVTGLFTGEASPTLSSLPGGLLVFAVVGVAIAILKGLFWALESGSSSYDDDDDDEDETDELKEGEFDDDSTVVDVVTDEDEYEYYEDAEEEVDEVEVETEPSSKGIVKGPKNRF